MSKAYISQVKNGKRPPSQQLLSLLENLNQPKNLSSKYPCADCDFDCHIDKNNLLERDFNNASRALDVTREKIESGDYEIVVLDEICLALDYGLINWSELKTILKTRPSHVEVVCTGRNAPKELMDFADLITFMREEKHPYRKGQGTREGIEY